MKLKIVSVWCHLSIGLLSQSVFAQQAQNFIAAGNREVDIITPRGAIKVELFQSTQPDAVKFFLKNITSGFYNNTIFHRVIEGFALQGGGYDSHFNLKEMRAPSQSSFPRSSLKNNYGTLSLVLHHDNSPLSSPQFFINLADNNFLNDVSLNFQSNVIGKVIDGMEMVEKIAHLKVGQREGMYNVPFYPAEALIQSIIVVESSK